MWGSYARTALPEAFSSAKYNADNEQTERGSKKFGYDANGNLASDGTSEYKWNARNQLTNITGTIKATYGYDPYGRRTTRTLGSTTTELLYDGPNVVAKKADWLCRNTERIEHLEEENRRKDDDDDEEEEEAEAKSHPNAKAKN
jgi:YD repeat-containing protein